MSNKNYLLVLFTFFLCSSLCRAQTNLVPNPSFEDTVSCPTDGDIIRAKFWANPTTYSPDYFNQCVVATGPGDSFSVPNNWYGIQTARTGRAYGGFILHAIGDNREYIQANLLSSLTAGEKYNVSFYVAVADSSPYATNDVGLYLSNNAISSTTSKFLPYFPQISNNPISKPLTTANTWNKIQGTYKAIGGEQYITIGNFKDDANSDTTHLNNGAWGVQFSYYYIDDVSVTLLDTTIGINDISILNNKINISPNPTLGYCSIKSSEKIKTIEVFNLYGQLVLYKYPDSNNESIDLNEQEQGIYFLIIKTLNNTSSHKLIITTKAN